MVQKIKRWFYGIVGVIALIAVAWGGWTAFIYLGFVGRAFMPDSGETRIGEVTTALNSLGITQDDKIGLLRFDDPKVTGVSCYMTRAEKGGVKGWIGVAENPSNFAIDCIRTGPVKFISEINKTINGEKVFSEKQSLFFKVVWVNRIFDADKNTLTYLIYSDKVIDGSPFNDLSVVRLND